MPTIVHPGRLSVLLLATLFPAGCAQHRPVSSYGPPPRVHEPTPSWEEELALIIGDELTEQEQIDLRALRLAEYLPPAGARPPELGAGLEELLANEGESIIEEEIGYDIPIVLNDRVEWWIDYFSTNIHDSFARYLARSSTWLPYLKDRLREAGLPEDLVYLALIESGFSTQAVSRAGAVGPWQFMSYTGREYGLRIDRWVDERRDYERSTQAAIAYLSDLHDMFDSWFLAAAGYNGGQGRVGRSMLRDNTVNFWELTGLHSETKNYVPKLIAATIIAKEPEKFGFRWVPRAESIEWATVTVPSSTDLDVIADVAGVPADVIRGLNPHLLRGRTPPGEINFPVKIPPGSVETFRGNFARLTPEERTRPPLVHLARAGETLAGIASAYDVSLADLARENDIGVRSSLEGGERLVIPGRTAASGAGYPELGIESVADLEPSSEGVPEAAEGEPIPAALVPRREVARSERGPGGSAPDLTPPNAARARVIHSVRSGETLASIARRYGVSVSVLRSFNGLDGDRIVPGSRLGIP
jgi:membrane-bound lytic murein transglycosylase D